MCKQIKLTSKIIQFLNNNSRYALLRNFDGLPETNTSRDIDIVIHRKDFFKSKKVLEKIILDSEYKIFNYYLSDRMISYVLINEELEFLQFDFFFNTSLHGIILIKSRDILSSREFNGKLFHVSKDFEFLDKYIYFKSLNLQLPTKYKSKRKIVLNNKENFDKLIHTLFGVKTFSKLESLSSRKLITILFFRHFLSNILSISNNIYLQSSNLLSSQGLSLSFTGPDGVGKTTVINKLIEFLSIHYSTINKFHHRPNIIGNLSSVAKKIGFLEKIDDEYNLPHRGKKNGLLSSFLRLGYYSLDYIFGYWLIVKPKLFKREIVIFDRYYSDIIVDSRRSSIFLSPKLLYLWGKLFIPSINYKLLFIADTKTIFSRKQELNQKSINNINIKLKYLSKKKNFYLINNNGSVNDSFIAILKLIISHQHLKNLKRI